MQAKVPILSSFYSLCFNFFCLLFSLSQISFWKLSKNQPLFYAIIDNPAKALKSSSADAESPLYGADKIKIFFQQRDLKSAFGSFALGLELYKMRLLAMKLRKQSDFISPLKTFFTFSPQLVRLSRIFENWSFFVYDYVLGIWFLSKSSKVIFDLLKSVEF